MLSNFRNLTLRRVLVMLFGIVMLSIGVALFDFSKMGNDPSTSTVIVLGDLTGLGLSGMMLLMNSLYFIAEILLDRSMIGLGTFVNWMCIGPIAELLLGAFQRIFWLHGGDLPFFPRLIIMLLGVLILSFGASLYQTADTGIAPYDALSIIMSRRQRKIPYFWCRIITESACAIATALLGGIVGLGTLICALGLGPFITFFDRAVSRKLCGIPRA